MGTQLDENFWLDDKVHELGPIGIAVWTCIITGKHASDVNLPGLYKISCEDIYWQLGGDLMGPGLMREVENAFWVIVGKGMALVDPKARQLRLPNVWKYAPTPNPNQISGWKVPFLKAARTPFRSEHLPILRKLAERCLAGGVEMFDARFGLLDPNDNRTYHLGNNWKPGEPPLPGIRKWLLPEESPLPSPGIDKDHLYLSRRREEETLTSTLTLTLNGGSRRVPEGFPNPSNGATGKTEESDGVESTQEGFPKGSGGVSEVVPIGSTKGLGNGSGRVSGQDTERRNGSGNGSHRAASNGDSSKAERDESNTSGNIPTGNQGGGGIRAWLTQHCPRVSVLAASFSTEQLEALSAIETRSFWVGIETRFRECARCPEEGGACDPREERLDPGELVRLHVIDDGHLVEETKPCNRYQDFVMARRLESAGVGSAMSRVKLSELGEVKPEVLTSFDAFMRAGYRRRAPRKVQLLIEGSRSREYGVTLFRQVVKEHRGCAYRSVHVPTLIRDTKDKMTAKEPSPLLELADLDVLLLDAVEQGSIKPKFWFRDELLWLYERRRDNGLATIITSSIPCKEAFPGVSVLRV